MAGLNGSPLIAGDGARFSSFKMSCVIGNRCFLDWIL